jgi:hypothetical protein
MPPNLPSKSIFHRCALSSPACYRDSVESNINFAKLYPIDPNLRWQATVAQIVMAKQLVPPGATQDTILNHPSVASTTAIHDETRSPLSDHLEGKNQAPTTLYLMAKKPLCQAFHFPPLSPLPRIHALHIILVTIDLHLPQPRRLRTPKHLNLNQTPMERQSHHRKHQ